MTLLSTFLRSLVSIFVVVAYIIIRYDMNDAYQQRMPSDDDCHDVDSTLD